MPLTDDDMSSVFEDNMSANTSAGNAYENDIEMYHLYPEEQEVTYMIPVPKLREHRDLSLMLITILNADTIGLKKSCTLLKVLLDTGSTSTMILQSVFQKTYSQRNCRAGKLSQRSPLRLPRPKWFGHAALNCLSLKRTAK